MAPDQGSSSFVKILLSYNIACEFQSSHDEPRRNAITERWQATSWTALISRIEAKLEAQPK